LDGKIYITGLGIVSAIGNNVQENIISLKSEQPGIGKISFLDTVFKNEIPVGEVKLSDHEIISLFNLNQNEAYTRTALFGIKASKEALENAGIKDIGQYKTGLISATTVAGMSSSEKFYSDFLNTDYANDFIKTHEAADSTEKIAEFLGINAFMTTISTACSSAANAILMGARMIKHGYLERVVVGGSDVISKFTLNGFNTLMILDREPCKPFDRDRKGLNLGEGAAYLVLESEAVVVKEKKKPLAILSGYANANDAYHQTASSPDGYGPWLAMSQALENAELKPENIDYINVHGTGTDNNDLTEGLAIRKVFGEKIPKFSSTKAYTGHTLAAAGAIEAVFSVLAIQNKMIIPNLRFKNAIEETGLIPETRIIESVNIRHVLSNSFGFGGNGTSLVISKC
jgi:3-oxoacyl-(acyl-carrier-protein) synthase